MTEIELDLDHYTKLVILSGLWKEGSPAMMVSRFIEDSWGQLGDCIPGDLSLKEFREIVDNLPRPLTRQ